MRALIFLLIAGVCFANPPDATHHGIEETQITDFRWIEVGVGDTVYGAIVDYVKRSDDEGDTWVVWRNFDSDVEQLWCDDATGIVYLSVADTLKRITADGTAADVLTFPVNVTGNFPFMAKNDSLYCVTYCSTEAVDDTTGAYLYRSSTGDHWTLINHPEARHYHFVAAHPWNDTLYTSRGDGNPSWAIEKSGDNGANFTAIRSSDCKAQPTGFAFTPTRCIFGSDCGGADVNKFYFQDNTDGLWTVADSLSGAQENCVWSMTQNAERVIFAGTTGKGGGDDSNDVRIYASWDSAGTWNTVKTFDLVGQYAGILWMSQRATATGGYMFYTIGDDDLSNTLDTYRFKNLPVWTVGTGGDFADVATALADWRVGAADTLIMLAGTHTIQDDAATAGLTVRGATRDASLYLMKNGAANASGFTVAVAGVTFKDLTFRTLIEITTSGKSMVEVADGGQLTLKRCAFRDCDANSAPGILATGTGAGATTLTLNDCIADSCSADIDDTPAGGFIYTVDLDAITIDGLVATNNWSNRHGGVLAIENSAGDVLIKNSLFVDNRCRARAGAIYIVMDNGVNGKVWHCTFDGNESSVPSDGQLYYRQIAPNSVISHCIFANSDSTYALAASGYPDSVRHCDSWNTGNDNFGWNAPVCTDTIHIDPNYDCTDSPADCYSAKTKECRVAADGGYMGWSLYTPPVLAPPEINPALHQSDYFQDLYAASDTVCCHSSHWDEIVPDLIYAGKWSIYPFGAKSKKADGINVKIKRADSENGWSESVFVPINYDTYKNEFVFEQLLRTAVDTVAVQAVFSTCAAGSTLQYQFIMEGW